MVRSLSGSRFLAVALLALVLSACATSGVARIMEASVRGDGRELALTVDTCNADLSASTVESPSRVTVTVTVRNDTSDDCADGIIVHLDQPLGNRQLFDASGGVVPVVDTDP